MENKLLDENLFEEVFNLSRPIEMELLVIKLYGCLQGLEREGHTETALRVKEVIENHLEGVKAMKKRREEKAK